MKYWKLLGFESIFRWINFNFFGNSSKSILSILGWILFFVGLWWVKPITST